ncbi:MAG: pyridoxal phosphate-dependent aminotransferase family protein [Flavitalea sp.]
MIWSLLCKDMDEDFLRKKIERRREEDAFRKVVVMDGAVDFCSNDYLGIVKNKWIEKKVADNAHGLEKLFGSTGSRLLSGNYGLIEFLEADLAKFHEAEAGLIFNSGYDANIGLLSCVPQRGDIILYDKLCHASIRDGIRLSLAEAHSFEHNNVMDLESKVVKQQGKIFVVTESVFSMDGDMAPLKLMTGICEKFDALLIVDESHATGVIGENGGGLVQELGLQKDCFARMHTFGKAIGSHGAVILGSQLLKDYLINFSRPFIFTTALPASAVLATGYGYAQMKEMQGERLHLQKLITLFKNRSSRLETILSNTPIQAIVIPGNKEVKNIAVMLQQNKFDVRPILYPTVPVGKERLRIVLHAFNTVEEVEGLVRLF